MSSPLENLFSIYTEEPKGTDELEVKFFTKTSANLSRIDFNNVIQGLKSKGFTTDIATGQYLLRIQNEFIDRHTGRKKMSNIRTELHSLSNIKDYCQKNGFDFENPPSHIYFYQKRPKMIGDARVPPVDFDDFNFRVDIKEENPLDKNEPRIKSLLSKWNQTRKNFRFLKRFTFTHTQYPLKVDCTIVKSSKKNHFGRLIPTYTIEESNVLNNPEVYEIEIELNKAPMFNKTSH